MSQPGGASAIVTQPAGRLRTRVLRYLAGSVVATMCSELAFVLLYGVIALGTTGASVLAWLAGAVPNFWLNRSWTWRRTGRPSLRHEVLPYVVIVVTTLVAATAATALADRWLHEHGTTSSLRVALVAAVFLGVYVAVFAVRFVLFGRLFGRPQPARDDTSAMADSSR